MASNRREVQLTLGPRPTQPEAAAGWYVGAGLVYLANTLEKVGSASVTVHHPQAEPRSVVDPE